MTHATFDIFGPAVPDSPIVVSVPHAGRDYPDAPGLLRHPIERLRPLEDRYADRLAETGITNGASAIVSRMPRLWIDLNRAESDLDATMVIGGHGNGQPQSQRARGGLGLIPRRVGDVGEIWKTALSAADVAARVEGHYLGYHEALSMMLRRAHERFGVAMLIDLHSMPPLVGTDAANIILGDRFGTSCAPVLVETSRAIFSDAGYSVGTNAPYAGGHIITHHADRRRNVHALQVEVDRSLYLDNVFDRTSEGLMVLQTVIAKLVDSLERSLARPIATAAE